MNAILLKDKILKNHLKSNLFKAQIFDITGKQLIHIGKKIYFNSENINVSYLKPGIYFVQLEIDNNTKTIKFIKR